MAQKSGSKGKGPEGHEPTQFEKVYSEIVAHCWKDEAFKKKFLKDPRAVFEQYKLSIPDHVKIHVTEQSKNDLYLSIPPNPSATREASRQELEATAGGTFYQYECLDFFSYNWGWVQYCEDISCSVTLW